MIYKEYSLYNEFTAYKGARVWLQLFFDDGSVSQSKYIPQNLRKEDFYDQILAILKDTNRTECAVLTWGCGQIHGYNARILKKKVSNGNPVLKLSKL